MNFYNTFGLILHVAETKNDFPAGTKNNFCDSYQTMQSEIPTNILGLWK